MTDNQTKDEPQKKALPRFMEKPHIQGWIKEAIDCIEKNRPAIVGKNIGKFNVLKEELFHTMNLDSRNLRISEDSLRSHVGSLYAKVKTDSDPVASFGKEWHNLMEELHSKPVELHKVGFPLNLTFSGQNPQILQSMGIKFKRIDQNQWEDEFLGAMDPAILDRFTVDSMNPPTSRDWTYWTAEIESREPDYTSNRFDESVEVLLGSINFHHYYWQTYGIRIHTRAEPRSWSKLKTPFMHIVIPGNDEPLLYYSGEDMGKRKPFRISRNKYKLLEFNKTIGSFDETHQADSAIISALRRFQAAMASPKKEESFVYFWQVLENCTFSEERDKSNDVISRASGLIRFKHHEQLAVRRLNRLSEKRNQIVHGKPRITVSEEDHNLIKTLADASLSNLIEWRKEFSKEDIQFLLDNSKLGPLEIQDEVSQMRNKVRLLQELLKWKKN